MTDGRGDAEQVVQVWQQPDGLWRWRWVQLDADGEEETSLVSHQAFESESEATESAGTAYPGVTLRVPSEEQDEHRPRRRRRLLLGVAAATVAVVFQLRRRRRP